MPTEFDYIKTADRWRRYSEEYFREARNIFFDLSRSLITLATFLFILGVTILQFSKIDNLPLLNKWLLIASWVFLLLSILFGLYLSLRSNDFLNGSGTAYEDSADKVIDHIVETQKDGGLERLGHLQANLPRNLNLWPFWAQSISFFLGFVLTLLFGATLVW